MPVFANGGGYPYANYNGPGTDASSYIWTDANGNMYSPYRYVYRNCTDYVAWKLDTVNGWRHNGSIGNAANWGVWAKQNHIVVDSHPAVGAVAWYDANHDDSYGHVAYVDSVETNTDGIVTGVQVSEYNNPAGSGAYHSGAIAPNSPTGYIHFADTASAAAASQPSINKRLVGDVNGDGKADTVVMFGGTGVAKVALSTGSGFGYPGDWAFGQSKNATDYWLGDTNGDGKADLVAYYASLRAWFVSLSSGSGFWTPTEWSYDDPTFGAFSQAFIADVNGDGKADKVEYMAASGNWFVSLSDGNGFWGLTGWIGGHGVGSNDQFVADFNGDGKADAAVYVARTGNWYVALSTGYSFGYPGQWAAGHGLGTSFRLVGDVDGDHKADAVYFSAPNSKWYVGSSAGGGFWSPTEWSYDWPGYNGLDNAFMADADGDGRADRIIWFRSSGNWYVSSSSGSGFWLFHLWISGDGAGS